MGEVDDLVRTLVAAKRLPGSAEAEAIQSWMLSVAFPTVDRHLSQRVADQQWIASTTISEYRDDLNEAIRLADRLAVYERRGGVMAATISRTSGVVPRHRVGRVELPLLLVVYSADRDILVTGYQFSGMAEIAIPEDALWAIFPS